MARPSKSIAVLESEKRSHRTKAELKAREMAEKAARSGRPMKETPEVKKNADAHREFLRVSKILTAVGNNDALYEATINRYCEISAEILMLQDLRAEFARGLAELRRDYDAGGRVDATEHYRLTAKMHDQILSVDKQITAKRKAMFDIEKECGMTVASAARSIPKKAVETVNPLLEVLAGGD